MLNMFFPVVLAVQGAAADDKGDLSNKIAGFFDYLIGQIPSWIAGFIVFVLTIFVAKMAKSAVESRISDQIDEEHQEVLVLSGRVTFFGTLIVGITVALKIAGIDLTTILAAVAFGIGFALQDLIMNFLSGVLILLSRHIKIGDFIKVGATVGKVMEIQTRATILKAVDGTKVIVPNSEIFSSQVVSYTANPLRRVVVPLYISYDTDISYATKIALGVLKKHPKIQKKPVPSVIVKDYGDSTIDLSARFWVGVRDGWFKVRSEIMHQMWDEFVKAGIVVPYNITHLETGADTAEYEKEAQGLYLKRKEEMKLSKLMAAKDSAATAVAAPANGNGNGQAANPAAAAGEAMTAAAQAAVPAQTAQATVPVEPPAAFQDYEEIDGQA